VYLGRRQGSTKQTKNVNRSGLKNTETSIKGASTNSYFDDSSLLLGETFLKLLQKICNFSLAVTFPRLTCLINKTLYSGGM
jgi:hypothetical protein